MRESTYWLKRPNDLEYFQNLKPPLLKDELVYIKYNLFFEEGEITDIAYFRDNWLIRGDQTTTVIDGKLYRFIVEEINYHPAINPLQIDIALKAVVLEDSIKDYQRFNS